MGPLTVNPTQEVTQEAGLLLLRLVFPLFKEIFTVRVFAVPSDEGTICYQWTRGFRFVLFFCNLFLKQIFVS